MNKMQKLVSFLTFYFTPPSAEKQEIWEGFADTDEYGDVLDEWAFFQVVKDIAHEEDEDINWDAMMPFVVQTKEELGID